MIIACWSGPRNISTALMRSWSSRKDTFVTDEPFYAYYLKQTQTNHPMHEKIINRYLSDYDEIVNYLINKVPDQKNIWYQKHMAHHFFDNNNMDWIVGLNNCLLIRDPKAVIGSYKKKFSIEFKSATSTLIASSLNFLLSLAAMFKLSNSSLNVAALIVPPFEKSVVLVGVLLLKIKIDPVNGGSLNATVPVDAVPSVVSFISYTELTIPPPPVKETVGEVV